MVISSLLAQVQQHESEYVIMLINSSARSVRTALIILHHPDQAVGADSRRRIHQARVAGPCTMACLVTALRAPEEPGTARRVEDWQGTVSCPRAGNAWVKTVESGVFCISQ